MMMLGLMMLRRRTGPKTAPQVLCEPAQSKCTWRFHKSHFIRKFTGKMPRPSWSTLIKHQPLHLYRKNPAVWTHCLGKYSKFMKSLKIHQKNKTQYSNPNWLIFFRGVNQHCSTPPATEAIFVNSRASGDAWELAIHDAWHEGDMVWSCAGHDMLGRWGCSMPCLWGMGF